MDVKLTFSIELPVSQRWFHLLFKNSFIPNIDKFTLSMDNLSCGTIQLGQRKTSDASMDPTMCIAHCSGWLEKQNKKENFRKIFPLRLKRAYATWKSTTEFTSWDQAGREETWLAVLILVSIITIHFHHHEHHECQWRNWHWHLTSLPSTLSWKFEP